MEVKGLEETILRLYSYLLSEYTKFGDELVKLLLENFPWFGQVLDYFATLRPVIKTKYTVSYTFNANTLTAYLHAFIGKLKVEVPSSYLDPIVEHIKNNLSFLIEYECLASLIDRAFFGNIVTLGRAFESPDKLRKKIRSAKDRENLLKEFKKMIDSINWFIDCINKSGILSEFPDIGKIDVNIKGTITLTGTGLTFPIFLVEVPVPYYPQKLGLLAGYVVLSRANEYLSKTRDVIEKVFEDKIPEIEPFYGTSAYVEPFVTKFTRIKIKWGGLIFEEGILKILGTMMKNYEKARKKAKVKIKDLKELFSCIGALLS